MVYPPMPLIVNNSTLRHCQINKKAIGKLTNKLSTIKEKLQ